MKMNTYTYEQRIHSLFFCWQSAFIDIQPIADRVAQYLEIISITFNLVPGVPGFSWDLSFIPWY